MDKPVRVEVKLGSAGDEVMFTALYSDGYRVAYWRPFWRAMWHIIELNLRGLRVEEPQP